jgi:hypothetical protein
MPAEFVVTGADLTSTAETRAAWLWLRGSTDATEAVARIQETVARDATMS